MRSCAVLLVVLSFAGSRPAGGQTAADPLALDPVVLSSLEQAAIRKGEIILRTIANPGLKGRTYEAVGTLPGTLDEARAIILDYRHYGEFMPRVERTVVTDESPTVAIVEEHLKLPLGMSRRYRLRYTFKEMTGGFRVDWAKVPWPEVPPGHTVVDTWGHWQVGPMDGGGLLAVYYVYTDPGHVPLGMKGLAMSLSKHDLPKVVERVRARLKRRAAAAPIKD